MPEVVLPAQSGHRPDARAAPFYTRMPGLPGGVMLPGEKV